MSGSYAPRIVLNLFKFLAVAALMVLQSGQGLAKELPPELMAPVKADIAERFEGDFSTALQNYTDGCKQSMVVDCHRAAVMLQGGLGAKPNVPRARDLYEQACSGGNGLSCFGLGISHSREEDGKPDLGKAAGNYERACDAGYAYGCAVTAVFNRLGVGVKKNRARSVKLHVRACESGYLKSCLRAADRFLLGEGVKKDFGEYARLARLACERGQMKACYSLAYTYSTGRHVTADFGKSRYYLDIACDGGNMDACGTLGLLHRDGENGFEINHMLARSYLRMACAAFDVLACTHLAEMYEKGLGVEKNLNKALDLYKSNCDRKSDCLNYNRLRKELAQ